MTEILTSDDITSDWVTQVLRSNGLLDQLSSVASVQLEPFGDAESMMSSLRRVTMTYDRDADAPQSLIVKLASENEGMRFVAGLFRFYEREVRFYNELRPSTMVASPPCLLAEMYDDDRGFVIVLEEVADHRHVDQLTGLGLDDAMTCMHALADLHAPMWGADLSGFAETMIPFDSPMLAAVIPDKVGGDWQQAKQRASDSLPEEMVALCDRYHRIVGRVMQDMCEPNTMAHGDFRSDNLLFATDGAVVVLDFQLMAICNGLTDVAYCVSQSIETDLAQANGDALVDAYLARLAHHGITIEPDQAMKAYKAGLIFYLSIPFGLLGTEGLHERAEQLGITMLQRAAAEILRVGAHLDYP